MPKKTKLVYGNLTPKQKKSHLILLETAVLRTRQELRDWESRLNQLKQEMKK